jgi:hypothetical protein
MGGLFNRLSVVWSEPVSGGKKYAEEALAEFRSVVRNYMEHKTKVALHQNMENVVFSADEA